MMGGLMKLFSFFHNPHFFVWFAIKKGRKESILVGPTKIVIPSKVDGK
jgi:hypothetical protein